MGYNTEGYIYAAFKNWSDECRNRKDVTRSLDSEVPCCLPT